MQALITQLARSGLFSDWVAGPGTVLVQATNSIQEDGVLYDGKTPQNWHLVLGFTTTLL